MSTLFEKLLNRGSDIIITSKSGENYPDLEKEIDLPGTHCWSLQFST